MWKNRLRNEKHRQISTESCEGKTMSYLGPVEFGLLLKHLKSVILKKSKPEVLGDTCVKVRIYSYQGHELQVRAQVTQQQPNTQHEKVSCSSGSSIPTLFILKL